MKAFAEIKVGQSWGFAEEEETGEVGTVQGHWTLWDPGLTSPAVDLEPCSGN